MRALLDTGPLVALLDKRDASHARVVKALSRLRGRLITTAAVVTEAMHFVSGSPPLAARLVEFLEAVPVEILDVFDGASLTACCALMKRYADIPMDFADATLVLTAETTGLAEILTLDVRGFSSYRFRSNKRFHLLLQKPAE